jgi:hypothetical protein
MNDQATLRFQTKFHSQELSALELPVEIRAIDYMNSSFRPVRTLTSRTAMVAPGQYFVTCRLPAGQELQGYVDAVVGGDYLVELNADSADESPSESLEVQHFLRGPIRRVLNELDLPGVDLPDISNALESIVPENIKIAPKYFAQVYQKAKSFVRDKIRTVRALTTDNLSVSWYSGNPLQSCTLLTKREAPPPGDEGVPLEIPQEAMDARETVVCQISQPGQSPLNSLLPLERFGAQPQISLLPPDPVTGQVRHGVRLAHPTADLLCRYLRRGMISEATDTLNSDTMSAETLLYQKMTDPIAATIGAYTILRLQELEKLHEWTENLMNRFPELPDGAAIRAEHLARAGKHRDALVAMLQLRERGLPIFTEGFSFALDRLRLYTAPGTNPPGATAAEIGSATELLKQLSRFATYVDFDRTYLTYTGETPDHPGLMSDP